MDRKHYRAVHYIVVYRGVYIEIQIKTLFEEGWGEIDHSIYSAAQGKRHADRNVWRAWEMRWDRSTAVSRLCRMRSSRDKETIVRKRELKPQVKAAVEKRDLNEIHTMDDAVWSILKE